jgi:hypothetical protein
MPDPIPLQPRVDDTAADTRSLVQLGREEPPPVPAPPPETAPAPDTADEKEAAALAAALSEAGIEAAPGDQAAVRALASLDPATVSTVERWLKAKKPKPDTGPGK